MPRADIERELADFLAGESWPDEDEHGDPVPVQSLEKANDILRRLKWLTEERDNILASTADEIARIQQFRDDRVAGVNREIAWGERSVENFMRSLNEAKPRVKSQKLSNGVLKLTKPSERVTVVDEKAFLEWCGVVFPEPTVPDGEKPQPIVANLAHPEFVRLKPEPAKSVVKAQLTKGVEEPGLDGTVTAALLLDLGEDGIEIVPGVVIEHDRLQKFDVVLGAE
jgi:hypothetical protein